MGAPQDSVQLVEVDGLRIAYRREGQGAPVVFLHGFFGDHRVWRRQFELANEFTVVAWDAPGCGGSSVPPPAFRMAEYADTLAKFIERLELDRPHVVGNSFGGPWRSSCLADTAPPSSCSHLGSSLRYDKRSG